jgi:hypothetical protein
MNIIYYYEKLYPDFSLDIFPTELQNYFRAADFVKLIESDS